jgi:hypothetical protein
MHMHASIRKLLCPRIGVRVRAGARDTARSDSDTQAVRINSRLSQVERLSLAVIACPEIAATEVINPSSFMERTTCPISQNSKVISFLMCSSFFRVRKRF